MKKGFWAFLKGFVIGTLIIKFFEWLFKDRRYKG